MKNTPRFQSYKIAHIMAWIPEERSRMGCSFRIAKGVQIIFFADHH